MEFPVALHSMIYAVLTVDVAWHFSVPFGIKNDRLIIQWRKKYWQLVASVSILFFAVLCEYVVGCISVLYTPICYTHVRCKVCVRGCNEAPHRIQRMHRTHRESK